MENNIVTTIVSIIALVLSIGNAIYIFVCNHKKIDLKLNSYTKNIVNGKYAYIFDILIENKSRLPISINSLKIIKEKKEITFNPNPKLISEITSRSGKTITDKASLYSTAFPINILGLNDNREFFELSNNENLEGKCIIKILTNRGKVSKKINLNDSYIDTSTFMKEYKDLVKSKNF